jgi:predicted ester cyclase
MADDGKTMARRFLVDAFAGGNLGLSDELLDPGYIDHDAGPGIPPGPEGIRALFTTFRTAFPDVAFAVYDQIQEGDRVVTRYTFTGTHQAPLWACLPPAGGCRWKASASIGSRTEGLPRRGYDTTPLG